MRLHQEQRRSTSSPTSRANSSTRHPPPSPQPCFSRVSFFLSAGHPTSAQASQDKQAAGRAEGAGGHAGPALRPVCAVCLPSSRPQAVQLS